MSFLFDIMVFYDYKPFACSILFLFFIFYIFLVCIFDMIKIVVRFPVVDLLLVNKSTVVTPVISGLLESFSR